MEFLKTLKRETGTAFKEVLLDQNVSSLLNTDRAGGFFGSALLLSKINPELSGFIAGAVMVGSGSLLILELFDRLERADRSVTQDPITRRRILHS